MQLNENTSNRLLCCFVLIGTMFACPTLLALESDRQKPLEVNANTTDGTLGDGITTLSGDVEIRQGTLHITADEAAINKVDGRVKSVTFHGQPAFLEQEIEEQGLVQATANIIDYQVASGLVTLEGDADVTHPQYKISGDLLTYDLNIQHFQGKGGENGNGRIHIQLDPEVVNNPGDMLGKKKDPEADNPEPSETTPDELESKKSEGDDS